MTTQVATPVWDAERIDSIAYATPAVRWQLNIEALRVLKRLEEEGRPATEEEKAKLALYTGFGDTAFNPFFKDRALVAKYRNRPDNARKIDR